MTGDREMPAVVFGEDGREHVRSVAIPELEAGEVILRVDYCGICGSDLHASAPDFRAGVTMGHEFSGTIVDVGPDVSGWRAGDRVCVNPNSDRCGECEYCQSGEHNKCTAIGDTSVGVAQNGGMALYAALRPATLRRLPDELSPVEGAWVEPLAVALRTVRTSRIAVGDSAVVYRAGPIGLLVIKVLRMAGVGRITAVEPSPLRARLAADVGADDVVDPGDSAAGEDSPSMADAPRYAFECSGVAAVTAAAVKALPPRGVLTVTGFPRDNPFYSARDLLFKELEIRMRD